MKTIFHLDMDQFFVAVELKCLPHLRGKPVIVGGDPHGRGIVTTASYEARRFGVKSGMPAGEAFRLCPQAIFLKPDGAKYVHASEQVLDVLREYTDRVEPVSIDEAYLDVTDALQAAGGVERLAYAIKNRIKNELGLSATIGAGPNRLVAKMASGMNKPDGFTYLPAHKVAAVFRDLPVGDLYGVGRATERVLESFGIRTIGQLADFPAEILRRRFGKWGEELVHVARGEGSDVVQKSEERPDEKSMGHEHTFGADVTDAETILGRLHLLSERVARRLRAANMAGRCVSVKIRYRGFETNTHEHKLKRFVQHETDIYPVAEMLFHESYESGRPVRLVGVQVCALWPTARILQLELFMAPENPDWLARACDEIKDRFGESSIGFASGIFHAGGKRKSAYQRMNRPNMTYRHPLR